MEKKGKLLLFISVLIILYTEFLGVNIDFSLKYLPILIVVMAIIILNIKCKKSFSSSKVVVATNLIVILIDAIINIFYYIFFNRIDELEIIKLSTILPIAILAYNIDKVNLLKFDKDYFIGIAKYFILPLLLAFTLEQSYVFFISSISKIFSNDLIDDVLLIIFKTILADISFVALVLALNDKSNTSIHSNIFTRNVFIAILIIILIVFVIKIFMLVSCIFSMNNEIAFLQNIYPANNINQYDSLNVFDDSLVQEPTNDIAKRNYKSTSESTIQNTLKNSDETKNENPANSNDYNIFNFLNPQYSFNEIFTDPAYNYLYNYRVNMSTVNSMLNSKKYTNRQALSLYNTYTKEEISLCTSIKPSIIFQIFSIIIIYAINIASISIVYKAKESI